MKILYFNVIEQNAGWGAEYFLNKAFKKLGVQSICIDFRKYRLSIAKEVKKIKDFDYVLVQRGDYFPEDLIKVINRPKIFYFSELVSRRKDADELFKSNCFDHYLVRGPECKKLLIKRNWLKSEKISVFLSAIDEDIYNKIKNTKKDIDVLFLGSLTERRKKILNIISEKINVNIKSAFGKNANEYYNRAKIVLNIHAEEYLDTETRIFEVLGSGSFLISEKLSSENPFINKKHYIEAKNIEDMCEKILYYLENNKERERIAQAGYNEAVNMHTYFKRAEEIINIFSNYKNDSSELYSVKKINYLIFKENIKRIGVYFSDILFDIQGKFKRLFKRIFN